MSAFLSSVFGAAAQALTNQAGVLSGGKIYTYIAGSTTPAATWTDSTQGVQNSNPIILDSAGRIPNEIWLQSGQRYKFVITDSNNVQIGQTWDNISGINDASASQTEWLTLGLTPTYLSASSFSVSGNQTTIFTANRRVQTTNTGGTLYGYIVASSYGAPNTTVNVVMDNAAALDSGLSVVNVGVFNATNPSIPAQYEPFLPPVTVPSATTTLAGSASSANVTISGSVTIAGFDAASAGIIRFVTFSGAPTLTNSASFKLPGGVNITASIGDTAIFQSQGSGNWACLAYSNITGLTPSTGTGSLVRQTNPTINNIAYGITSTVTSGVTLTLTNTSTMYQEFTGSTAQTVVLPVTSTLSQGQTYTFDNKSTALITVESSGGTVLQVISPSSGAPSAVSANFVCRGTGHTDATDWSVESVSSGQMLGNAASKAIFWNSQTIAENLTLLTGTSEGSVGPITINSGYAVTIQPGARWAIQ